MKKLNIREEIISSIIYSKGYTIEAVMEERISSQIVILKNEKSIFRGQIFKFFQHKKNKYKEFIAKTALKVFKKVSIFLSSPFYYIDIIENNDFAMVIFPYKLR